MRLECSYTTPMHPFRYRPRFCPSKAYYGKFLEGVPPIRVDWRSGGYCGISTNSLNEAIAWVRQALALGLCVTHRPEDDDPT